MENTINISDSAATRIAHLLKNEPQNSVFRITVDAGGCNGFQYKFEFTPSKDGDISYDKNGVKVVTDDISLGFLNGATLDFIDELGGSFFKMTNPNASSSCGCGTSFAVL